ncbi:hypothetical protein B0H14DRAFT_2744856 [Mycena olivaceomarginata]|nr:hypothetical protein B0H14DRAFT_2744856 [Mycena olivaceomarginata]
MFEHVKVSFADLLLLTHFSPSSGSQDRFNPRPPLTAGPHRFFTLTSASARRCFSAYRSTGRPWGTARAGQPGGWLWPSRCTRPR